MDASYRPQVIESRAQRHWEEQGSFRVREDPAREKFYCLSMFPYHSGRLHMGHVRNYTIGDVIARYQRMLGRNVLQPMGWDAFGLPAENAAIQHGMPAARWTYENIEYMRRQLRRLGFGYDWERELATCRPDYYHWEQWLFVKLFEKGLAYRRNAVVNWDPVEQTVLANEQVTPDGRGWRSGALVERREIPQWFLKITAYADELLEELDRMEGWPEAVRTMQRNWIGRSVGVEVDFAIEGEPEPLRVYTTRPDTLMGVSYMAVAPDHPLATRAGAADSALAAFLETCRHSGVTEAALETMEKKGMPLGLDAIHPITGARIPVWVANFVLMGYGTGAVMAVPAHDQRDYEFARQYGLPVIQVIAAEDGQEVNLDREAFTEKGLLIDSDQFTGLSSEQAFEAIADHLEGEGRGRRQVHYRLRDWGVSRQRYWGAPIPMIHCPGCGPVPVPESRLPVVLPEDVAFEGVASPIKKLPAFYEVACPRCGGSAERETDTFDTFMESSWYYARFACPDARERMLDPRADYWLPVDQYVGGIEHAILHLLYARFFHKLMRDIGLVSSDEPFTGLLTQGMVVAETYQREEAGGRRTFYNPRDVAVERDEKGKVTAATLVADGRPVVLGGTEKMSKSKNNGVDPEELIDRYGADTVRLFIMFAAPPSQDLEWSDSAVEGAHRFLRRLWSFGAEHAEAIRAAAVEPNWALAGPGVQDARREIHGALRQAAFDFGRQQFNTVVSAGMKILNALQRLERGQALEDALRREGMSILLRLLAPIVPHVTHGLWQELGFEGVVIDAPWPAPDESALAQDSISLVVQVNGKLRGQIRVPADASPADVEEAALGEPNAQRFIEGRTVRKIIVVPGKLVNIVA